ncbi:hypothetical protein ACFFRR_000949 [Megaselia abdita]
MTIPTRPAPPPPIYSMSGTGTSQQRLNGGVNAQKLLIKLPPPTNKTVSQHGNTNHSITRHFPKAKVNSETLDPFELPSNKKGPAPPRPPPPKTLQSLLKKPNAPPTSVNIVSNLFGKKKSKPTIATKPDVKFLRPNSSSSHVNPLFTNIKSPSPASDLELINFDSPSPSSPTFTQKSNSDCVSVDSFSSDSNFSSPNNGNGSQPESGFEDDFSASRATTSPADPWDTLEEAFGVANENIYSSLSTAPVRDYDIVCSRIQPENILCNGKNLITTAPALNMPTIIKPKISQKPKAPKPPILKINSLARDDLEIPMPSFAPPPPPTISELQSVNKTEEPYGIALYDFQSIQDGDLPLTENDKIYLLSQINEEWFYGRNKRGCEGIFPSNYIDIRVPLQRTTSSISSSESMMATAGEKIRALYTFVAQEEGDLTFYENDVITVLSRINEDWLYGEINGQIGQFPSNYLEYQPTSF